MSGYILESGVPSSGGVELSEVQELILDTREATSEDIGAMAHIFIQWFRDDSTARLLYQSDSIWPVVVDMIRNYLDDDYTYLIIVEEKTTEQIVGWTSVSVVTSGEDDYFKYCDSTVWAGRQLLRREARARGQAPVPMDEMKKAALISKLREHNRNGQNKHADEQRMVINTVALHPEIVLGELPEVAGRLFNHVIDFARGEYLPVWMQLPEFFSDSIWEVFVDTGFDEVGSVELNLSRYTNEEHRSQRQWGVERWAQWVLPVDDL